MICISIVEPTAEKCLAALDGIGFAEIRIAMASAVAGLSSEGGVSVLGWECVSKFHPRFFEDLKSLGGDVS